MSRYTPIIFLITLLLTTAQASERLALIIGNAAYQKPVPTLDNPVNDANDMAKVLRNLGFEVILKHNLSNRAMTLAVQSFGERLAQKGGVGLFYFSGHGLQAKGRNFLVPVDAKIGTAADIPWEALDANRLLAQMEEANNGLNIVILDACRDNPYQSNIKSLNKKGLAEMKSPTGSLIAYATAPDTPSYGDKRQRNSIYTKYLLDALRDMSHLSVLDMLTEVTQKVVAKTKGVQVPWKSDSLTQRFCFSRCGSSSQPQVSDLLRTCKKHFQAYRLTTGVGGNALDCYSDVLKKDRHNAKALEGLEEIEEKYLTWIKGAVRAGKRQKALQYMAAFRKVNPESPKLRPFEYLLETSPVVTPKPSRQAVAGTVFRDSLQNGNLGPKMVWIAAGSFRMGDMNVTVTSFQGGGDSDEKPVHRVSIKRFAMGQNEVTVGEFRQFVNARGYRTDAEKKGSCFSYSQGWKNIKGANWRSPGFSQNDNHPVVCVSWNDATAYAKWLSQQTGKKYRLPSEAEWEYAARARTTTKYWWGNNIGKNRANCYNCGSRWDNKSTAPVGSFAPNAFGLYDTVGNVWEWFRGKSFCSAKTFTSKADSWHGTYKGAPTDGQVWKGGNESYRVRRGGSWYYVPWDARSAYRGRVDSVVRNDSYGFRVIRGADF